MGGQVHDVTQADELLEGVSGDFFIGDRAYDKQGLVESIRSRGGKVVIPSRSNCKKKRRYSKSVYRMRNRIERMIGRLKNFRRLATRFEKTAQSYLSFVMFACSTLWLIDDTP